MAKKFHHYKARSTKPSLSILPLIFLILLGLGLAFILRPSPVPVGINEVSNATGLVNLSLVPADNKLEVGDTAVIEMKIEAGSYESSGINADLSYDSRGLQIVKVEQGDFFPTVLTEPVWQTGKLEFAYGAPASGGKSGSGGVARITVKYLGGTPTLGFTTGTIVGVVDYEGGNALRNARDASFSPFTSVAVSPSPDPSPDPSPILSTSPKASPSPSPLSSPPAVSATTTISLKNSTSCNQATLKWEGISGAKGYYVDISKNVGFTKIVTSGKLSPSTTEYSFSGLDKDTLYYARITQVSVPDFPHYGPVFQFKTLQDCVTGVVPTPTPSAPAPLVPSVRPSATTKSNPLTKLFAKPSPTPSPTPVVILDPSPVVDRGSLNDVFTSPAPLPVSKRGSFLQEFFAWVFSIFKR